MQEYDQTILKTLVTLKRNFEGYFFTNKLSVSDAEQIAKGVYSVFEGGFDFKKLKNIKEQERLCLLENEIITDDMLSNLDISYLAQKDDLSLLINGEEHIAIRCSKSGLNISECFNKVQELDDILSSVIPISYSKEFGYLTSNFQYYGCGIKIEITMFLPALFSSGKIEDINQQISKTNFKLVQKFNNAPIYILQNLSCHNISEDELISKATNLANEISEKEQKEQVIQKSIGQIQLKDTIYRSIGISKYCYAISLDEAVKILCDLKYGIILGYLQSDTERKSIERIDNILQKDILSNSISILKGLKYNIKNFDILEFIANIQDSNLQRFYSKALNVKELEVKRAEYINNYFSKKFE